MATLSAGNSFRSFLFILIIVCSGIALSIGTAFPAKAAEKTYPPPYKTVMSQDSTLCEAVKRAYNSAFSTALSIPIQDRDNTAPDRIFPYTTNFEAWTNPLIRDDFQSAGLKIVAADEGIIGNGLVFINGEKLIAWPGAGLINAPIYNDGKLHWISSYDSPYTPSWSTIFALFEDGLTKDQRNDAFNIISSYDANVQQNWQEGKDPEIIARVMHYPLGIGLAGAPVTIGKQYKPADKNGIEYPLQKWPNFIKLMSDWEAALSSPDKLVPKKLFYEFFPVVHGPFSQRLYQFSGKLYFIGSEFAAIPLVIHGNFHGGLVVAYEMTKSGPNDLCYLIFKSQR